MHSWHSSKPSSSPSKSAKKSLCACWAGLAQELLTWSSQQLRSCLLGVGPASCPSLRSVVSISPNSCVIRSCVSGTQQQACPFSGQGDVASQPHLTGEKRGCPALRPDHPGKQKKELFRFIPPHPLFLCKSPRWIILLNRSGSFSYGSLDYRIGTLLSQMQASLRGDGKVPGGPGKPCSKAAAPTPPKRRNSTLWSETLDIHQKGTFSTQEIKRQEVRVNVMSWIPQESWKVGVGGMVSSLRQKPVEYPTCSFTCLCGIWLKQSKWSCNPARGHSPAGGWSLLHLSCRSQTSQSTVRIQTTLKDKVGS